MTDAEFYDILDQLGKYIHSEKNFVDNPFRQTEIRDALTAAYQLLPDAKIELRDDPLQLGALIIHIEADDISATGEREINLFHDIICKADNFEIYSIDDERVYFALVFQKALIRV